MSGTIAELPTQDRVQVVGPEVRIRSLDVEDPVLAGHLAGVSESQREAEVAKILAVGVRGMTAMGAGATVQGVGEEVERALQAMTSDAEQRVKELIEAGRSTLAGSLDPDIRSSVTARTLDGIASAHGELLDRLDPARSDSHSARLLAELNQMLGPAGALNDRLRQALDPDHEDSTMGKVLTTIDRHFRDMRDLIAADSGRALEARRGTAKGHDYEEGVVDELRLAAGEMGGCAVEATGAQAGLLEAGAKVGDAVLTLSDGTRVVIEAKNTGRITLAGKGGILDELDRAMTNRDAAWAICMSAENAYPEEVGAFGIYDNKLLVVDDGEGVLLRVALRWARAAASLSSTDAAEVDVDAIGAVQARLQRMAQRFSGAKRALAGVRSSVDQVRSELDGLRVDLLDLADDLAASLRSGHKALGVEDSAGPG